VVKNTAIIQSHDPPPLIEISSLSTYRSKFVKRKPRDIAVEFSFKEGDPVKSRRFRLFEP